MTDVHCGQWHRLCDKRWEQLEDVGDNLRFCHTCQHAVHRVTSLAELAQLAGMGKCVARFDKEGVETMGLPRHEAYSQDSATDEE